MVEKLTAAEFHARPNLCDWRVLLGGIEAGFVTGSFDQSVLFVQQIGAAAEAVNHQPDIDLRYPDRVRITLGSHPPSGLTEADAELATTISALASGAGIASDARSLAKLEVAIDAVDIDAVRPFWKAILGYVDESPSTERGQITALVDPLRIGPAFWFQQMDAPRPQRNRIHLDVTVPHDVAAERVAGAVAAGGRLLSDKRARAFWVLADPEGNEACVCTWQDRD